MNAPTTFRTPSGEEMVVLPRAEYDRLLEATEMAADVAAFDEVQRALAAGEEEFIPFEMVDRMLAGESPIRVWRQYRGLTLDQLAAKTGLAANYLSQIETGKRVGTVDKLKAIAEALNLTLDDIV